MSKKKVLRKFTILCCAEFIATLGHGLDTAVPRGLLHWLDGALPWAEFCRARWGPGSLSGFFYQRLCH